MSSQKNKKKVVAAVLLVLCAAMLCLLLVVKLQGGKSSGGGGGGGGGGGHQAIQSNTIDSGNQGASSGNSGQENGGQQAQTEDKPEDTAAAESKKNETASAPVESDPDSPALKVLSWKPYDERVVLVSKYKVVISGEDRQEVLSRELPADVLSLKLKDLGLKENQQYWYKVLPFNSSNMNSASQVKVQQGSFYVDLESEVPGSPKILSPKNGGQVAVKRPVIEWERAVDKDPHQSAKLTYKVALKGGDKSLVWSGETQDSELEIGSDLKENSSYTVEIKAVDPDGNESALVTSRFAVNATKDKPTQPKGLVAKKDMVKKRMLLSWKRSSDPNPGSSVNKYIVTVKDVATNKVVWTVSVTNNSTIFNKGEYGKNYVFQVKGKSTSGVSTAASPWSSAFLYIFGYDYVPELTSPAKAKQQLSAKKGIVWKEGKDISKYVVKIDDKTYETDKPFFTMEKLQKDGTIKIGQPYTVSVAAKNRHGFTTDYSKEVMFILADSAPDKPGTPEIFFEDGKFEDIEKDDALTWRPSKDLEGDVRYSIEISADSGFGSPGVIYEVQPEEGVRVLFRQFWSQWRKLDDMPYFVRVIAKDSAGNTTASSSAPITKN